MAEERHYLKAQIGHVPARYQDDVATIEAIIRDGFAVSAKPVPRRSVPNPPSPDYVKPVKKLKPGQVLKPKKDPINLNHYNPGKILRIVLFGDVLETNAPEAPRYDLFVEVNKKEMTRPKYWTAIREQLTALPHPVYLRVDYARKVNAMLRDKEPFYTYVLTEGVLLHANDCNIWPTEPAPVNTTPAQAAEGQMARFMEEIKAHKKRQKFYWNKKRCRLTGFEVRNTIEQAYHMVLTLHQGHSYPEQDLTFLRNRAEAIAPNLKQAWFYQTETYEEEFDLLRRAHTGTHKATEYEITEEEIGLLTYRQKTLLKMAQNLCTKKIESLT
ncbi:MAG: hypothetical protein JKY34_11540 [Kordiimonadaceae bacterium]|nr:hypothetical protein [Kordiimonadaceae bacterium]